MKKIISLFFASVMLFSINACTGYKPIFDSSNLNFQIQEYEIVGNRSLGKIIYTKLFNASQTEKNEANTRSVDVKIDLSKSKNPVLKDSAGKILEYQITLDTKVKINDYLTGNQILNQSFANSTTYRAKDKYSETIKLENQSLENLLNKTFEELLIQLTQNISLQ